MKRILAPATYLGMSASEREQWRKDNPDGIEPVKTLPAGMAEAFAASILCDPNMKCLATEITEFGVTGTVVPRREESVLPSTSENAET